MTNFLTKSPAPPSLELHTKNLFIAVSLALMSFSINAAGPGPADANFGQADDGMRVGFGSFSPDAGNNDGNAVTLQTDGKTVVVGEGVNGGSADMRFCGS